MSRAQVKGEYGADTWHDLTAKRAKVDESGKEKDPSASIMDMMKQSAPPTRPMHDIPARRLIPGLPS